MKLVAKLSPSRNSRGDKGRAEKHEGLSPKESRKIVLDAVRRYTAPEEK